MLDRRVVVRALLGGAGMVALLALVVGVANTVVLAGGRGAKTDPQAVPHAQAALVLGALVQPDGRPSVMLEDRIRAAAALYRAGRVDKVLASGDHGRGHASYERRLSAVKRGRRRDQLASQAEGSTASRVACQAVRHRHHAARLSSRASASASTGAQPKFLGPRIDIAGSARDQPRLIDRPAGRSVAVWHPRAMSPRALLLAAVVAAATLVACGSDGDGAGATTPPADGDATAETTTTIRARPPPRRGVKLVKVGSFDQPLYVTAPPADRRRDLRRRAGGADRRRPRRTQARRRRSSTSAAAVTAGGEQGLLGLAFAPDYARSGLFYVYYTGTDAEQHLVEYRRAERRPRRPGQRPHRLRPRRPRAQPQRRPAGLRSRRAALRRHRRRRWRQRPARRARQRAEPRLAAGQDPAHRPARPTAASRSPRRPTTRSSTAPARGPRSTPTACATRGASRSTARTGDLVDRRRRPGRGRGDRLRPPRRRRAARTSAGARSRAASALLRRAGARRDQAPVIDQAPRRRLVLDHRRLRRARPRRARRSTAATSTATTARAQLRSARLARRRRAATDALAGLKTVASLSSFGEDAAGRVYVVVARRPGLPVRRALSLAQTSSPANPASRSFAPCRLKGERRPLGDASNTQLAVRNLVLVTHGAPPKTFALRTTAATSDGRIIGTNGAPPASSGAVSSLTIASFYAMCPARHPQTWGSDMSMDGCPAG